MPTTQVDDPANPRLHAFADLKRPRRPDNIVVEGEIAVARALRSTHPIDSLLLTPAHHARLVAAMPEAWAETLPVFVAEAAVVREIVGFDFHRGCLAAMPRPVSPALSSVVGGDPTEPWCVLVCEGLADPANLGAIIRNARAFGVRAVVHGGGADPWSRRAIRAAMGLCFSLPIIESRDLVDDVAALTTHADVRTVAAVVGPSAVPLDRYEASPRTVLMMGNEGAGLSASLRNLADDAVTIPLDPDVDSLNVAAATAVLLWALCGQRTAS